VKLHTVVISYNRLELTKQVIETYHATVSVPHSIVVVDNGSDDDTVHWLQRSHALGMFGLILLGRNFYPGYACNRGFAWAAEDASFLHRQDNDFAFLPGWCDELWQAFQDPAVGQVGLRTDDEELNAPWNVGGCNVIRRELWDQGLRWDERPWSELGGTTEDYYWSQGVKNLGYRWTRVARPSILTLASGDLTDPYYIESYGVRGIVNADELRRQLGVREE